jgi:hypothetical protein
MSSAALNRAPICTAGRPLSRAAFIACSALALGVLSLPLSPSRLNAQAAAQTSVKPAPEIYLQAPQNNAVVGPSFTVKFGLRNYGVAPAGVNINGTGHFHILINVEPPAAGVLIPSDSLHRHFGGGQIETTLELAPGTYTLRAVLADHEHKVISRELVSAPIRVTVRSRD